MPPTLPYLDPARPLAERVEDLLGRMTLEEKLGQLHMGPMHSPEQEGPLVDAARQGKVGSTILDHPPEVHGPAALRAQRAAVEESRLRIPLLFGCDAIHGYRTIFPIPLALGCTWEPGLVEAAQAVSARESRCGAVNWTFTPMSDIALDPRWGRVAESFGEDPHLVGKFVAASVRGLQGTDPAEPDRTAATLKHFVGYGASVGGRDYNHTEVPPQVLRNLHLPPFEAGVQASAASVMSAFHANDGIPAVANRELLTGTLRDNWRFGGAVVSDYNAVQESIVWGHAADGAEAALHALTAGNDIDMVSGLYREHVPALLAAGKLAPAVIDEAVRRVLRIKFQLGLFERPYATAPGPDGAYLRPADLALARRTVSRSAVLLRNDGVLPIAPTPRTRIALLGPLGDDAGEMLGTWACFGRASDVVTLAAALRVQLPSGAQLEVQAGCELQSSPRTLTRNDGTIVIDESAQAAANASITGAVEAARRADVSILAVGEPRGWSGENASRSELGLTGRQAELVEAVAALGKPLVLLVFSGRPLILPELRRSNVAILQAWHPGIQAGPGLVDVLLGVVPPTGRLTMSWPRRVGQIPVYYNRLNTGRPTQGGYRDVSSEPQHPFGYGLTYTTFQYGPVTQDPGGAAGAHATVRVTVTNTGTRAGDEVVQLYVQDVACSDGIRPVQELRGWQRISLQPGESREVAFTVTDEVLAHVDRQGRWRTEPGVFRLWIAPHAGTCEPVEFVL
jgi:beta-glucosidase